LGQELHAKIKEAFSELKADDRAQEIIDKFRKLASNYGDEKELKKTF
jgi:cell fate (sporulation/competence/biofilm development) regulator YlbF (YheA/YmcA/DUF963 family)